MMVNRRALAVSTAALASTVVGACTLGTWTRNAERSKPGKNAPLADSQILRINLGAEPASIDPQLISYVGEIGVVMRVFANLLTFDAGGTLSPHMAERMPAVSTDGKTITVTLKPGLTYSDGHPLTARDFEYGWKRLLDPRLAAEYAFAGFILEGGEEYATASRRDAANLATLRDAVGVRAKDDRTLEFKLKHAAPWFLSVLATWCGLPVRESLIQQAGDRWTEPTTYIGNGPYVLREWDHHNRIVLEANPHYRGLAPVVKTIELHMISDPSTLLAAYRNEELDIVDVHQADLPTVMSDPKLKAEYQRFATGCTTYLAFNARKAPFDRPTIRRAFSLALDRDRIVADVLGGIGVAADQLVPHRMPGHYASLRGQKLDVSAAQRQLVEAGYPNGRGLPSVKLTYAGGARNLERVEAIIGQLKRNLGVDVLPDPIESREYAALLRSPDTAPAMYLYGWCQDYPDPQAWYSTVFHSKSTLNRSGWSDPQFDQIVEQADVERDRARRDDLYRRGAQLLVDQAPVAFLYHSVVSRLVKPYVAGLETNPLDLFEGQSSLGTLRILRH